MFPAPFPALLDACVLYPFTLRDTLLRCAERDLYQPYWSDKILDEATRNLVKDGLMTEPKARRLMSAMNSAFPAAVVADFAELEVGMRNDPKDRHVAAAALKAGARVIVSSNVKDFKHLPDGYEVQSPDEFLSHLYDLDPALMVEIIREQATDLDNPPRTPEEIAAALEKTAPKFGKAIQADLAADRRLAPASSPSTIK